MFWWHKGHYRDSWHLCSCVQTAGSVHRFEGNMQQIWKDKEQVLSLLGSVCSGRCGYYWGQYHAELASRPSDARTTLSECGNSHFCFLFLILIQSFCAKVALAENSVLGFLVDFNSNWSVTSKVLESEKGKRPQIELSYCQSRLGVILSPGATVNILIEASLVSWEVIE